MPKKEKIICPECGKELMAEQVEAELVSHWGILPPVKEHFPQAHERYMFLKGHLASED